MSTGHGHLTLVYHAAYAIAAAAGAGVAHEPAALVTLLEGGARLAEHLVAHVAQLHLAALGAAARIAAARTLVKVGVGRAVAIPAVGAPPRAAADAAAVAAERAPHRLAARRACRDAARDAGPLLGRADRTEGTRTQAALPHVAIFAAHSARAASR